MMDISGQFAQLLATIQGSSKNDPIQLLEEDNDSQSSCPNRSNHDHDFCDYGNLSKDEINDALNLLPKNSHASLRAI
jgi:hypothetical protein